MIFLNYSNIYGRLGNHLYLALQAYKLLKKLNTDVKYITNNYFFENNVLEKMKLLNIDSFVVTDILPNNTDTIIRNNFYPEYKCYHLILNEDFTILDIEGFIREYILKSNIFNKINNDTLGIHIRLGDYESSKISNCFNKIKYLETCINDINLSNIKIFSDNKNKAYEIISSISDKHIIISDNTTDIDDFIELCCIKHKILWNSTFSYWSAFISNVIFQNSYNCIYTPSKFSSREPECNHINPLWNIIYDR